MKYNKADEYVAQIFQSAVEKTNLDRYITFCFLESDSLKLSPDGLCTKIIIPNNIVKSSGNIPECIVVVNSIIFNRLDEDTQKLVAENTIAQVTYNDEKDLVTHHKPDFQFGSGMLNKHGFELLEATRLAVESQFQRLSDEQAEEKAAKKTTKRGRGRKIRVN